MSEVHVDLIGTLTDSDGCRYVLVWADCFTRRFTATARPQADVRHDISHFIQRLGVLLRFSSEDFYRPKQSFLSNDWQDMLHYLGPTHTAVNAYSPRKNGQCERLNRSLEIALRAQQDAENWVHTLPMASLSLPIVQREDYGASLAQMLYGVNLRFSN